MGFSFIGGYWSGRHIHAVFFNTYITRITVAFKENAVFSCICRHVVNALKDIGRGIIQV